MPLVSKVGRGGPLSMESCSTHRVQETALTRGGEKPIFPPSEEKANERHRPEGSPGRPPAQPAAARGGASPAWRGPAAVSDLHRRGKGGRAAGRGAAARTTVRGPRPAVLGAHRPRPLAGGGLHRAGKPGRVG